MRNQLSNGRQMKTETMGMQARLPLEEISRFVFEEKGRASGRFGDILVRSAFQPIYSLAHRRPVGYEALLRPYSEERLLSPLTLFSTVKEDSESVMLDRLCRFVHVRNFLLQNDETSWIFLNINPKVTVVGRRYGEFFASLLEENGIAPHRVVVEILESQIQDEALLSDAVNYYKELGCLVAIDDFGSGESNFDRLWRIGPHIVKLDRSIISQAAMNLKVRRVVPNLIKLIHETGSLALMEGVENEEEAMISMNSGADFVQGYFFARPEEKLAEASKGIAALLGICEKFKQVSAREQDQYQKDLDPYIKAFERIIRIFSYSGDIKAASANFLQLARAERCFLLDDEGMQLGSSCVSDKTLFTEDPRFLPLHDASDAIWLRRHYFRRAIAKPGEVQISRPYLSIASGNMCVTLSIALEFENGRLVLCGDILWDD